MLDLLAPLLILLLVGLLLWWLLIITEGVFLGRRLVVWLYDVTAKRYDGIKQYTTEDQEILVVEPLLALTRVAEPHLLDVATGTGRVPLFLLADERFDGEIVALDASRKMLAHAEKNLSRLPPRRRAQVQLIQRQAVPLPFPDASFDVVTCLEALEFLPSDSAALREMARVLKPGGFLMTTRRRQWEGWLFLHRYRSPASISRILRDCGMSRIQVLPWQNNYDAVIGRKRG